MSENGKNVNSTLRNVVVTRLASAEETFFDGTASLNSANGATDAGSNSPGRNYACHSGIESVEISTVVEETTIKQYQHLHPSFHQTLIDFGKQHGFWPWLTRFGELFGYKQLLQVMITVNSIEHDLEALVISQAGNEEDAYLKLIRQLFDITCPKKSRIGIYNSFYDAVALIKKSKNILVLTGAGVSVSCGIPDFRSKNGIYSRLAEFQLSDPQEMFDIHYFRYQPETFYSFALEIYPSNFQPSISHHFIRKLEINGALLRNYSQNIDTLETKAGIERVINCHGSFKACTCLQCHTKYPIKQIEQNIFDKSVPYCKCGGVIKPDITFFGEGLPSEFHDNINEDLKLADLLIVVGTSLKVQPVCNVVELVGANVPQILINRNRLAGRNGFDVELLGDCDIIITEIEKALGCSEKSANSAEIFTGLQGSEPWVWKFEGAVVDVDSRSGSGSESSDSEPDSCENDNLENDENQDIPAPE